MPETEMKVIREEVYFGQQVQMLDCFTHPQTGEDAYKVRFTGALCALSVADALGMSNTFNRYWFEGATYLDGWTRATLVKQELSDED